MGFYRELDKRTNQALKERQEAAERKFEGASLHEASDLERFAASSKVHLVGGKILEASDLDGMNRAEVIARKHQFCTIRCADGALFLAKNRYNESENAWEPSEVMVNDEWVNIDVFDDEIGFSYSCEDYRQKWQKTKINS